MRIPLVIAIVLVLLISGSAEAALFINEFSSSTTDSDWVEIYNSDSETIDLANYVLRDSSQTNKIILSGTISSNGFATFDWDDSLNNGGDTIYLKLKSDENNIVDQITYGSSSTAPLPSSGQSGGRNPDGSGNWVLFSQMSKGESNNSSTVFQTPTPPPPTPTNNPPTPTPTNAPTPTKTPTPTVVATANTPIPTKKPTPTPTTDPAKTEQAATMEAAMMRAQDQAPQQEVKSAQNSVDLGGSLSDLDKKETSYNWGKLLILMGAVLVTCACGILVYNNYLKDKLEEMRSQP